MYFLIQDRIKIFEIFVCIYTCTYTHTYTCIYIHMYVYIIFNNYTYKYNILGKIS